MARELGADGVELDVRRSADGALVVHHDPVLAGGLSVANTPLAGLRAAAPGLPTLAEALDECAGLLVNIEIKKPPRNRGFDAPRTGRRRRGCPSGGPRAPRPGAGLVVRARESSTGSGRTLDAPPTGYLFQLGADFEAMTEAASAHGHRAVHPDWRGLVGRRAGRVIDPCPRAGAGRQRVDRESPVEHRSSRPPRRRRDRDRCPRRRARRAVAVRRSGAPARARRGRTTISSSSIVPRYSPSTCHGNRSPAPAPIAVSRSSVRSARWMTYASLRRCRA